MAWEIIKLVQDFEIVIIVKTPSLEHQVFSEFWKDSFSMNIAQDVIEYLLRLSHMAQLEAMVLTHRYKEKTLSNL